MKLVILDRDGVINQDSDAYIKNPAEREPIPGSLSAIAKLTHAGCRIAVASNQSGVGRGIMKMTDVEAINEKMHDAVEKAGGRINGVFVCPHAPDQGCECRKPKPGLLLEIAKQFDMALDSVPFIGDKLADVEAALAAGAFPILVRTGYGEHSMTHLPSTLNLPVFRDLSEAVDALLEITEGATPT